MQRKFEEAEPVFRSVCTETNRRASDWNLYATVLFSVKSPKVNEGVRARARACELDSQNAGYRMNYGLALRYDLDKPVEAAAQFQLAAQLEPSRWEAWYELAGCVHDGQRDVARAIDVLRAGTVACPKAVKLHELLGYWLCDSGRWDEGRLALVLSVELRAKDLTDAKPAFTKDQHGERLSVLVKVIEGFMRKNSERLTSDQSQQFESLRARAVELRDQIRKS
jgi:hypothetical protein